jgi:arylsulfatase A-like enzyme
MIAGLNAPFSGTKFQTWEGGVRMPAIAWWPGQIPPHGATSAMASSLDVFATVVELAGLDLDAVLCHKVKFTGLTQNWKLTQNFD